MADVESPEQLVDELTSAMREVVQRCEGNGMAPPFVVIMASPDGTVFAMRMPRDGQDPDVLAEHFEGDEMRLPVSVMILDQNGAATRVVIKQPDRLSYH